MSQTETPHVKRQAAIIVAAAFTSAAIYLGWAAATGVWGFALDDAWIHQTYARNLVTTGQFAFVPGQPSAGSTSGAWTMLIALGYYLGVDYRWWTFGLGAVCLAMTALGVWGLTWLLFPQHPRAAFAAGIFCAFEWHLVWAAVSGMETVLFTAVSTWLLVIALLRISKPPAPGSALTLGMCCGTLVLTRPEGLLLVGCLLLTQAAQEGWKRRSTWVNLALTMAGMMTLIAPWLTFNWYVSGTLFPNTFYAKQQEYAVLLATIPFAQRFAQVYFAPFIGAMVLLIPGLAAAAWALVRRVADSASWMQLAPLVWAVAHLGSYAARLPVTYQHGRYEMPVIPVLIVFGVGGTAALLRWDHARLWPRAFSRAAALTIAITQLAFVVIGARAYATDVAVIEGEMVSVARWLDANAGPNDLIAAHDIGAIGYFARRPLIDLAGLVSPEVIPFIRDEDQLWAHIQQRGAVYLVTFPSWYPQMTRRAGLAPSFEGNAESPEHMTVYRLP